MEPFWDRPHLHVSRGLLPALLQTVVSQEVQALPLGLGSVEQHTDNVDLLMQAERHRRLVGTLRPTR